MRDDAFRSIQHDTRLRGFDYLFGLGLFVEQPLDVELLELLEPFGHPVELGRDRLEFGQWLRAEPPGVLRWLTLRSALSSASGLRAHPMPHEIAAPTSSTSTRPPANS